MRQPTVFGKYVLLERISVGGMAEVFKAKSFGVEGFEKILAIKRILPSLAEDSEFIDMFIDEAKICGQLNHANIAQIYELGRVEDSHFIAMEFVWGKDVLQIQNRFRKNRQTMKPEMAAYVAAKLCEGLDYAHRKKDSAGKPLGIIHRDISPQNILVSYEGELKIIDFGIAKAASRSSRTQAGVLKGKFGYMSPEQVRGLPLDRRSDVFAIGTILYELLTADRVFMGESDFETLEKVRNVEVPPPSKANPAIPPALEKIILKALTKEVEDRYQWASDMQGDLQAFLVGYDPPFTSKQLSAWMRESFAPEMRREQEILDEQRKIGREILQGGGTGQLRSAVNSTSLLDDEDEDDADEKTILDGGARPGLGAPTPLPDQKTAILTDAMASSIAPPKPPPKGPASLPPPARVAPTELPAESTVILDGGTGATSLPRVSAEDATMLGDPQGILSGSAARIAAGDPTPTSLPLHPASGRSVLPAGQGAAHPITGQVAPNPGTGQVVYPQGTGQVIPPRSTLAKDILIGVVVAALLVGGVLVGRSHLAKKPASGVLVLTASPPRAAEVLLDGQSRGLLDEGKPLTIKGIAPGSHELEIKGKDGSAFKQAVQVSAEDVTVFTAALSGGEPPAPAAGALTLKIPSGGARVYVDGAQLSEEAWRAPISLRADVPHEVRVVNDKREEGHLSVTLRPGEKAEREVVLQPAIGRIKVTTDPPGAEVFVNGKKIGLSPAIESDLDPAKPAKLGVKLHGFASVNLTVSFEEKLDHELNLKLVEALDDGEKRPHAKAAAKEAPAPAENAPIQVVDGQSGKGQEVVVAESGKGTKGEGAKATAPVAASGDSGFLVANSQPWARVFIDGKDTGKMTPIAPRSKIPLKAGKHVVTFVVNGKKYNFDVQVKAGEDTKLVKQLIDPAP